MPCGDNGENKRFNQEEYGVNANSCDVATRAACQLADYIDFDKPVEPWVKKWVTNHRRWDAERKAREDEWS